MHNSQNITLNLSDVRDLFIAPELDPFASQEANFTGQSGLERVVRHLEESALKDTFHLTVVLPPDKATADAPARVDEAIDRYCRLKIDENLHRLRSLRRQGWQSLLRGLVFLGICMGLTALLDSALFDRWIPIVRTTLGEGLTVIGWVAMWHPFEALVYDPVPLRHENDIYAWLQRLDVKVVAGTN